MKRAKKKLRDIWQTVKSGINRSGEAQALPIARAESDGEHLATYCSHPVSVAVWSSTQLWPPHGACTWVNLTALKQMGMTWIQRLANQSACLREASQVPRKERILELGRTWQPYHSVLRNFFVFLGDSKSMKVFFLVCLPSTPAGCYRNKVMYTW